MLNSVTYSPTFQGKTGFLGGVKSTYDDVMEAKDDYLAVNIARRTNSTKRASAAVIGAASGVVGSVLLGGLYFLLKKKPKLNNSLFDEFIVKKFDGWIAQGKSMYPNSGKFKQVASGLYLKVINAVLTGAALGFGTGLYRTYKSTNVNGHISRTRSGIQGKWVSKGLYNMSKTIEGQNIIKNSIIKNDDGSVTVKFNGINKEYVITKSEMKKASKTYLTQFREDGKVKRFFRKYSRGDGDVLAVELAVEKYFKDVQNGVLDRNPNVPAQIRAVNNEGDILTTNGSESGLYYLMTGKTSLK